MTFSFHPEADTEFFKAINHYEECEGGLGYDFSIEVYSAIQNILEYPEAWPFLMMRYGDAKQTGFLLGFSTASRKTKSSYLQLCTSTESMITGNTGTKKLNGLNLSAAYELSCVY